MTAPRIEPDPLAKLRSLGRDQAPPQDALARLRAVGRDQDNEQAPASVPLAEGVTRSIARAIPFADEIAANIDAFIEGGGNFKQRRDARIDENRARYGQFRKERPKAALATEVGALIGTGAALPVARGAGILRNALEGVLTGAAYGAGEGEGGIVDRLPDAAGGGLLGGIFGAAAQPVSRAVASGAKAATRGIGRQIGKIPGLERVGQVARDATAANISQKAQSAILKSLERDNVPLDELATRASQAYGKPVGIADLAGDNTEELLATVSRIPSRAKQDIGQMVDMRHSGQAGRMGRDVEQAMGLQRQNVFELAEDLIKRRRTAADPLYEEAFGSVGAIDDHAIREILSTPAGKAAYQQALVDAQNNFRKLPNIHKQVQRVSDVLGPDGNPMLIDDIEFTQAPDLRTLDYVKKVFDRQGKWDQQIPSGGTASTDAATAKKLSRSLRDVLDVKAPKYRVARGQYEGDIAVEEALDMGRNFLKDDSRLTKQVLSEMSDSEKELFKVGALDAVRYAMDKAGDNADLVGRMFNSPEKRQILREVIGDEKAFARLEEAFNIEGRMAKTRAAVRGQSATAKRVQADADFQEHAGGDQITKAARELGREGFIPVIRRRSLDAVDRTRRGLVGQVGDEVGQQLMAGVNNSAELQRILQQLQGSAAQSGRAPNIPFRPALPAGGIGGGVLTNLLNLSGP